MDKIGKLGRVNKALNHLEQLGIVKELTAQKNRLFSYVDYIKIMSRETELANR